MNITTNLLNLQALIINNFKESENNITFFVSTLPSPQICPHCGKSTSRIHGYRNQIFKDLSIVYLNFFPSTPCKSDNENKRGEGIILGSLVMFVTLHR